MMFTFELSLKDVFSADQIARLEGYAKERSIPLQLAVFEIAANYLSNNTNASTNEGVKASNVDAKPSPPENPLKALGLGTRAVNALAKLGITEPDGISSVTREQLEALSRVGAKTITEILDLKSKMNPVEESQDEPVTEFTYGVLSEFENLENSRNSVNRAAKLYIRKTNASNEEVANILASSGYDREDPDTYFRAIDTIRGHLPIQGEQVDLIQDLAKKLDTTIEDCVERPLGTLSVLEADAVIEQLEEDLLDKRTNEAPTPLDNASVEDLANEFF